MGRLYSNHGNLLKPLLESVSATLVELASLPHESQFHDVVGFDILKWLNEPSAVPDREYMALAPMSFPINTLMSLCNYWTTIHQSGLHAGRFKALIHNIVGHSQGIFAAAAVAQADSWESFLEASDLAIQISFFVGLESHFAAPPAHVSAAAVQDCVDHGEGRPSPMLGVTGLNVTQIRLVVERVNRSLEDGSQNVCLALINSRDKHVLSGPPQSLRAVCLLLRGVRAPEGRDQSRIIFNKRQHDVDIQFLPISAPYHSSHLVQAQARVQAALEGLSLTGNDLGVPLLHTQSGLNLQTSKSTHIIQTLVQAVLYDPVDWPLVCSRLDASHILAFGPGNIASLIHESTEGTGVQVIQMNERAANSSGILQKTALLSTELPSPAINWAEKFAPRLVYDTTARVQVRTKMTDLFGTPPIMVAGMTPTTVHWDVVSSIMRAGYHVELAGGGYSSEAKFESAIRTLAAAIPVNRGIVCNLLYANPRTIAWQVSCLRRLTQEGLFIEGITIGAGKSSLCDLRLSLLRLSPE